MATEAEIRQGVYAAMADAFMMDASQVEANTQIRLREDLGASSMQYYPLIADLEDTFGVEFELHEFQYAARTVDDIVELVKGQLGA